MIRKTGKNCILNVDRPDTFAGTIKFSKLFFLVLELTEFVSPQIWQVAVPWSEWRSRVTTKDPQRFNEKVSGNLHSCAKNTAH